jgi:hypothetical protein
MAKRHLIHTKTRKKITIYVPKSHEDKFGKLQDKVKGYSSQIEKEFLENLVKNPKNMPKGYYVSKGNLDDFGKALKKLPSSSLKLLTDYANIVIHPIDTATNVFKLGKGVLELAVPDYIYKSDDQDMAIAIGNYFKDKYGSMAGFRKAATSDPAGILADVSMVFSGGATVLGKIPQLAGQAEKINKFARISNRFDPVIGTGWGLKESGKGVMNYLPDIAALPSGVGGDVLRLGYQAGREGGEKQRAFTDNMRGKNPNAAEDLAKQIRERLNQHKLAKQEKYSNDMGQLLLGNKVIPQKDFNKIIDNIIKNIDNKTTFKGRNIDKTIEVPSHLPVKPEIRKVNEKGINTVQNEKGAAAVNEIKEILTTFKENPNFHTAEGLDVLKGMIDDLYPTTANSELPNLVQNIITETRNNIKSKIIEIEPNYADVMEAYEVAHRLEQELLKGYALGNKSTIDTISRKLFQALRNNKSTNYNSRLNTLKQFDNLGDLQAAIAGLVAQSPIPVGGSGLVYSSLAAGGAIGAGASGGTLAALLALSSPRVAGEASNLAGRIAGTVNQMSPPPQVTGLLDAIPDSITQAASNTAGVLKKPLTDITLLEARAIDEEENY